MELEWNILPGFDTLQLCGKVKTTLLRLGETSDNFTRRITFMSMFRHFLWINLQKKNVWQTLDSCLCMQEDLVKDNGHSLVLVLNRSGIV